jgi:hypothetical protein
MNRRQLLAGAAATAAVAAMPAAAIEAASAITSYDIAWAQSVHQAWTRTGGLFDAAFRDLFPKEAGIIDVAGFEREGLKTLFRDLAEWAVAMTREGNIRLEIA